MKIRTIFTITLRNDPQKPLILKDVVNYSLIGNEFWFMEFERKLKEKTAKTPFGSNDANYLWIPVADILKIEVVNQEIFTDHNDKATYVKNVLTKN